MPTPGRARFPATTVVGLLIPLVPKRWLVGIGVSIVVGGLLPNLLGLSLGWLVARIHDAAASGDTSVVVAPLGLAFAVFVASSAHGPFSHAIASSLGMRFDTALREEAMRAAAGPAGISHLEDPRIADKLTHVEELTYGWLTSASVRGLVSSATGRVRGIIAGAILATFAWWAPLLVFVGYRAHRAYSTKTGMLFLRRYESNAQGLRRARYVHDLLVSGQAAKEARIFGFSRWAIDRFRTFWDEGMNSVWRERLHHEVFLVPVVVLLAGSIGIVAANIGFAAIRDATAGGVAGADVVARVVVLLQAMSNMQGFANQGDGEWQMHFGAYRAREARRLAEIVKTPESDLRGERTAPDLAEAIELRDVRFRYPGTERQILDGVTFSIPAGTSLAIVGENGAGKTTLIKLLCRLYDPTGGSIAVDGIPLRDIDPASWRREVGAIFQDFVRYELTARENIGVGAIDRIDDDAAIARVRDLAGADGFLSRIPDDATLSRSYADGVELSGGEWQRIALARALFAIEGGAKLLILDEPTANLDVRAEAAIYERFLEMTKGITTILISHRFSTVRLADRIVVIEGGQVVEQGSHIELIASGGRYAEMFAAQASAYVDGISLEDDELWEELDQGDTADA